MSDGRYFPNEAESEILSKYISTYFSQQERSVQRAQIVQTVVQILSKTNPHWNQRTVRLWFNNNKKMLGQGNGNAQNANGHQTQNNSTYYQKPKHEIPPAFQFKIQRTNYVQEKPQLPPRPISAAIFSPPMMAPPNMMQNQARSYYAQANQIYQQQMQMQRGLPTQMIIPNKLPQHDPKPESIAQIILQEKHKMAANDSPEQQEASDLAINEAIVNFNQQHWNEFVLPKGTSATIFSDQSAPLMDPTDEIIRFNSIEASYIVDGHPPAIVTYADDGNQQLLVGSNSVNLDFNAAVSSMAFDAEIGAFWLNAGNNISCFNAETLELIKNITIGNNNVSQSTSLIHYNNSLYFGSGSTVLVYSSMDEERNPVNFTISEDEEPRLGIVSSLPPISSMCCLSNGIVLGSYEHHTPHMFSYDGIQIARFSGHMAGITCLSAMSPTTFITGSADQTARVWDTREYTSIALLKHDGIITSACSLGTILFTGGIDGVVKQWDIRMNVPRVVCKCEGTPQTMHFSLDTSILTVVVSDKKEEEFSDLGKFKGPQRIDGTVSNAILNFQL